MPNSEKYTPFSVTSKKKPWKMAFFMWLFILGLIPLSVGIFLYLFIKPFTESLPSLQTLEQINPALITRIYARDSSVIHEFYTERRIWTEYSNFPPALIHAVMAIEDREFFNHWGINLRAYPAALLPALFGKRARGASTLTQQLAKNLFLTPERSLDRKIREALVAVKIEQTYTKEEILEFYLNQVYLGGGSYGFESAAQKYFSRPLKKLSIPELALLAGLLQRPESYRPDKFPEAAKNRRNLVLHAMAEEKRITKAQLVDFLISPINVHIWNPGVLFAPYFVEEIRQFLENKWGEDVIYGQGMHVYTTLDPTIQKITEQAYSIRLKQIRHRIQQTANWRMQIAKRLNVSDTILYTHWDSLYALFERDYINSPEEIARRQNAENEIFPDSIRYRKAQAAVVVLENSTGAILALVGGESFEDSKFNRAVQAVRSPGSSFKPIVYTLAIDQGATPNDTLLDQPITIPDPVEEGKVWRPKNYDGQFSGKISLREALYKSKNLPAIKLAIQYGLNNVVSYARKFGLRHNIPAVPSLGIGALETDLMELTSAYTVFPNLGFRQEPFSIKSIDDKDHNPFYNHLPHKTEPISQNTAYTMCSMLKDVNIRGTAASVWASGFHHPSGGKTGTTNSETDAWYIGFTRYYTAGVWVGTDDNKPLGSGHTGTQNALPLWLDIMKPIHINLPLDSWPEPEPTDSVQF